MPKQASDVDLPVIEAYKEIMHLPVQGHLDAVHAFQQREGPTYGRRRGGVVDVVRHGLMVPRSWRSTPALRHGVDQQRQRHHHEPPVNPLGFFDQHRRDQTQRLLKQPKAPCNWGLTGVGGQDLDMAPLASVDLGPQDKAVVDVRVVLNRLVIRTDVGLDVPCESLKGGTGGGATCAGVVLVCAQVLRVDAVVRPGLGSRCQGRLGGAGCTKALGVQVKPLRGARLTVARCGFGECRGGALTGRRRIHHHPALGHALVAPRKSLSAEVVITRLPGVPRQRWPDHR